jgi:hypothetical protein
MTSPAKSILADVNVWLATLVADHPHHEAVSLWWRTTVIPDRQHVAFCRVTQLGLLRLLSNERVMGPSRMDHMQAWDAVRAVVAQEHVGVREEPAGIEQQLADFCARRGSSPGFWTDAYLAAFAMAGGYRFASFDRGFRRFEGLDFILLADRDEARRPGHAN